MKKILLVIVAVMMTMGMMAQVEQIVGDWATVDDKTGNQYAIVHIYQAGNGLYYGKIAKMLVGPKNLTCTTCEGEDKNRPMEGLVIIRDMKNVNGELREGKVLDPESGKFYYGKIYLDKGKLVLRGSLDKRGIFGRNQTWVPCSGRK